MNKSLQIHQIRSLGDFIRDGFRIVFNNISPFLSIIMLYAFVPMAAVLLLYSRIQGNIKILFEMDSGMLIVWVVLGLFGMILSLSHINLLVFATFDISLKKKQGFMQDIDFQTLHQSFLKLYRRNLFVLGLTMLIYVLIMLFSGALVLLLNFYSIPFIIVLSLAVFLYLMPCIQIAQRFYMIDRLSVMESWKKGQQYFHSFFGSVIVLMIVSGIVMRVVQSGLSTPLVLLMFVLGLAMDTSPESLMNHPLLIAYNVIGAFGTCILQLFFILTIVLKSYDIQEQLEGTEKLQRISAMGQRKSSMFVNEGDY